MQTITPELAAILKQKLQAGPSGFSARMEVDVLSTLLPPSTIVQVVTWEVVAEPIAAASQGNTILVFAFGRGAVTGIPEMTDNTLAGTWEQVDGSPRDNSGESTLEVWKKIAVGGEANINLTMGVPGDKSAVAVVEIVGEVGAVIPNSGSDGSSGIMDWATGDFGSVYDLVFGAICVTADDASHDYVGAADDEDVVEVFDGTIEDNFAPGYWFGYQAASSGFSGTWNHWPQSYVSLSVGIIRSTSPTATVHIQPKRLSLDKSLQSPADQMEAEVANEDLPLGWGPTSVFATNSRCRAYAWYGEPENEVQVFEGLIDRKADHRDVLTTTITARSMMAILIDQSFTTRAPQTKEEYDRAVDDFNHGAKAPVPLDRTPANGVYVNMEASDIVIDILNRAGWPLADRDVTPTSYVLDEYVLVDGESWQACIDGEDRLTEYTGYALWDDESGVIHFAPLPVTSFTDPQEASYTFRSGEDIVSLDDVTDQDELITRVKVRGPLTTQTLKDTWREVWRTSKLSKPVGIWYDPAAPAFIRVLDRGTKRMYKIRQSDRKIMSSQSVADICPHPLGLSGDPGDDDFYWLLNAPWIDGGSGGNKVIKVRRSDGHAVGRYAIPDGRWSALKVSSGALWLTNLDTDKLYKRSKTDASAINSWHHTYNGNAQTNPSGVMVDGSDLFIFYANGGTTARFLKLSTSAPGTVVDIVKTAGTNLHGGEMDTTTHTECYGDSDSLGLVAKFTLLAKIDHTREVFEEAIDIDLEDELGTLAQSQSREHDAHPDDANHAFEVRRLTLDLSAITNRAQAADTARRILAEQGHRRRIVDVGILGNPAIQKTDLIAQVDPVTGLSESALIDTYRSELVAGGTYLGTLAVIPAQVYDDVPDDEGSGEDDDDIDEEGTPDETDPEEPVEPPIVPDDLPDVTHEFMGSTIAALDAFIAGLDDGTPEVPTVVGLPADGTLTGSATDRVHMETRHDFVFVGRHCSVKRTGRGNTPIWDMVAGSRSIRVSGVWLEGANPNPGTWVYAYEHEHGFNVMSATNITIDDFKVTNVGGEGVYLSGSTYWNTWSDTIRVTDGVLSGCSRMGVSFTDGVSHAKVDHLTIEYQGYYPFDFEPNGLTIAGIIAGATDIEISDITLGAHPYGLLGDTNPVAGVVVGMTGASDEGVAGCPIKRINIHDIAMTADPFTAICFDNGPDVEDVTFDSITGFGTFTPDINGWDHAFIMAAVDGLTITNTTQNCTPDAAAISHAGATVVDITTGNSF